MAYREVSRVEIAEVVRRWQSGISQRGISTGTGLSRATVRRYIEAVVEAGLARDGAAPSEDQPDSSSTSWPMGASSREASMSWLSDCPAPARPTPCVP